MTNDELKEHINSLSFGEGWGEACGDWLCFNIEPKDWHQFARQLRMCVDLDFDYLFCVTCVNGKTHLTMVYHLTSTTHRHNIVIKSKLDRNNPEIETVCDIWRTANPKCSWKPRHKSDQA